MSDSTAGPYKACHTSVEGPAYGVSGPGDGLGYYAAYLNPGNTFPAMEEAEKAARMMNLAFREGEKARSRAIAGLLGVS